MTQTIKNIRIYFWTSIAFILFGLIFILSTEKVDGHLFLSSFHSDFLDFFFQYFTHLGDGIFVGAVSLILVLLSPKDERLKYFLLALIVLLSTTLIVQGLKHLVFYDASRPLKFIGRELIYKVPGIDIHTSNSFPSGHTSIAFAFWGLIAYRLKTNFWQILSVLFAILVGYSRIYLSQHFLEDVCLGATIGLGCLVIGVFVVGRIRGNI